MEFLNIKSLVGIISLLFAGVVASPAIALPSAEVDSPQLLSQTDTTQTTIRGTIKTIVGDVVTLQMPNGTTQQVTISRADLMRLNLRPGMQVAMMLNNQNMATQVMMVEATTTNYTTQPLRGTIRSIARDVITLETPDGIQNVRISATEVSRLNLQPGMQIALMLGQNNVASGVSVVETNSTTTRVGTSQQVIQRTVQTTSTPVTSQSTVTRTTQVTQTNVVRPVRALW